MKLVPLSEAADVQMGTAPPGSSYNETGEGMPMIAGAGDYGAENPAPKKWTTAPSRVAVPGDLIVCVRATIGDLNWADKEYCLGRGVAGVRALEGIADINYLAHFIQSQKQELIKLGTGSTFLAIRRDDLKGLLVPLPPLKEQKRIATILDKADAIRRKRQQAIVLADQFLRSVFLDMFGDPSKNPLGFASVELTELAVADGIKCGPFGTQLNKSEFTVAGVPLWGIKHVNKHFSFRTDEFVSIETANRLNTYSLMPNDIVMTRKGTVGNASVYPSTLPLGIMHSDLLRIRLNEDLCNPTFLSYQLGISREIERQIKMVSSGAIMAGINVSKLKSIQALVPPLDLQQKFEGVAKENASNITKYRTHINCIDYLYESLAQRSFKGELSSVKAA